MLLAEDGDYFDTGFLKAFGYFNRYAIAATRGYDECAVMFTQIEIAQDLFREPGDVFQIHGLALSISTDHQVVECEGQFDDGIEPRERTVSRPHFFGHDAAVTGAKEMDHATGQDGFGKPISCCADGVFLGGNGVNEAAGFF